MIIMQLRMQSYANYLFVGENILSFLVYKEMYIICVGLYFKRYGNYLLSFSIFVYS